MAKKESLDLLVSTTAPSTTTSSFEDVIDTSPSLDGNGNSTNGQIPVDLGVFKDVGVRIRIFYTSFPLFSNAFAILKLLLKEHIQTFVLVCENYPSVRYYGGYAG